MSQMADLPRQPCCNAEKVHNIFGIAVFTEDHLPKETAAEGKKMKNKRKDG